MHLGQAQRKESVAGLTGFLLLYRADPSFLGDPAALVAAADALLVVGGSEGRRTVTYVSGESNTIPPLKVEAARLLAPKKP